MLGALAAVLPMCEEPVATRVRTTERWMGLQEFLIAEGSEPSIEAGLSALAAAGAADVVAVILSPQYSPLLMQGYATAVDAARSRLGTNAPAVTVAGSWHRQPAFVAALAATLAEPETR